MKYKINSDYGWLLGFDGEDYLWGDDRSEAWVLLACEVALHFNRVYWIPGVVLIDLP